MQQGIIVFCVLILTGCTKTDCWQCRTTTDYYKDAKVSRSDTSYKRFCDRTEEDIKSEESYSDATLKAGNYQRGSIRQTVCSKD